MVQVIGHKLYRQIIGFYHVFGVSVHEITVGLEMYQSVGHKKLTVTVHEIGRSKSLGSLLHLRIRESQPDFTHFSRSKEAVDNFDIGTQKSSVFQSFIQGFGSSCPHTCTFYIYSDKVFVGITSCQSHGIFTATAPQFQYNRIIVLKEILVPFSFHLERNIIYHRIWIFEHMRILRHICKLC